MKEIISENPTQMVWQMLLRYSFIDVINNWWQDRGEPTDTDLAIFISSCFRQAKSYFDAAAIAEINILPLLLYYGCVNLLVGTLTLTKHNRYNIKNHGMILDDSTLTSSADLFQICLLPKDKDGALHIIASEIEGITDLLDRGSWSLGEILMTIPDMVSEYQFIFPNSEVNIAWAEEVNHDGIILDRIPIDNIEKGNQIIQRILLHQRYKDTYLVPRMSQPTKYVILNRRPGTKVAFEQYSVAGERYLPIPINQRKRDLFMPQYLMFFLGLFILGNISRYHPELWDSFIVYDTSGKKNLINYFLQISERYFPNLVLNMIIGERIQLRK